MLHILPNKLPRRITPCLYQIEDHKDRLWNVRFERPTAHGWLLLLGRPVEPGSEEKNCYGGDQVIITHELAAYMEATRMTPGEIDLPVCITTVTRLRRVLGLNFLVDRAKWWDERRYDLTAFQRDAAVVHNVCAQTIARHSQSRGIVHGPSRWSPEEKEQLKQLLAKSLPTKEIAAIMGKGKDVIKTMRYRLIGKTSPKKPWSEDEKAEALRLLASGLKAKEVAKRIGRPKTSLLGMRSRAIGAVSPTKLRWSDDERARLLAMVKAGQSDQEIADALQRSVFSVRNMRQRLVPEASRRKRS